MLEIRDFDSPTLWANDAIFPGLLLTFRNLALRFGTLTLQRLGKTVFFFARSCLGKVPGRAPFSQLSKQATANTIRMQIVKQINENELDIRKLINQLCSKFQNELIRKRCSETKGAHRVKV